MAVVIAFFICWAPFHAQRLLYVYAKQSPYYREINEKMFFITGNKKFNKKLKLNSILISLIAQDVFIIWLRQSIRFCTMSCRHATVRRSFRHCARCQAVLAISLPIDFIITHLRHRCVIISIPGTDRIPFF